MHRRSLRKFIEHKLHDQPTIFNGLRRGQIRFRLSRENFTSFSSNVKNNFLFLDIFHDFNVYYVDLFRRDTPRSSELSEIYSSDEFYEYNGVNVHSSKHDHLSANRKNDDRNSNVDGLVEIVDRHSGNKSDDFNRFERKPETKLIRRSFEQQKEKNVRCFRCRLRKFIF